MEIPKNLITVNKQIGHISCGVSVITFRDKDTKQIIKYIPAFEITGYGNTLEQADDMINFCVHDFFNYLIVLTPKKIKSELCNLGWQQNKLSHQEFSNAFIDTKGNLANFNAEENSMEVSRLELV